jgi:hypothetical protein
MVFAAGAWVADRFAVAGAQAAPTPAGVRLEAGIEKENVDAVRLSGGDKVCVSAGDQGATASDPGSYRTRI